MFKRKVSKGNSFMTRCSSRGSDITKPNNTSLVVHQSNEESELDNLPEEITSALTQYEDEIKNRASTSFMDSFSQRQQSTPINNSKSSDNIKDENNENVNDKLQRLKNLESQSSYFNYAVSKCGAVQLPENHSYVLSEDQALFLVKLNKLLLDENSTEKFLKAVEEEISNLDNFKKMLVQTQTSETCQTARGPVQDPLMKLLLNVDCLQPSLFHILLGKLASIIMDSDSQNEDCMIVSSIITLLRFLNRVEDSQIAQKLFEIIEMAPLNIQREIIFSIPEIISKEEHEIATKQLLELLRMNSALTHVIIDALTNLSLSKNLRSQVRDKMLNRLDKCPLEFLPVLVQFIITHCDNDELPQVIDSLRKDLPFTIHHHDMKKEEKKNQKKANTSDEVSYVKLTFENLKFSLKASKQMTDAWIKIIMDITNTTEFRCIDLIMLIVMYGSVVGRKNQILSLFRSKIKSMILTEIHVHQTFKILPLILMEYSSSVLEIASIFLMSYESAVSDFAAVLYEISFVRFNSFLKQNVISEILLHIGTGTSSCITTSLSILTRLAESHKSILSDYTTSIMSLLIKLPVLEQTQVRNLVDIIASLIFSNRGDNSSSQDELQMFIRKQISSSEIDQHKKGVVAAIMYAKQAAAYDEEKENLNLKEINSLLEFGSSVSCDSGQGFFNDELATLLREVNLRKDFVEEWQDRTYKYVMDNLFVRNIDLECEYFPVSLQYALETDDDRKYVFPAVNLAIKAFENKSPHNSLNISPSFIRLLWCSTEDIGKILPFLSASVIMPEESIYEKFDSLTIIQQKLVMDCLFNCSNYFIECINALCTQKTGDRVLIRIKQLMELRKMIAKNINKIPLYIPPICQYYCPVQKINVRKRSNDGMKPKTGKKRKLDEEENKNCDQYPIDGDGPSTSTALSVAVTNAAIPNVEEGNLRAYRSYFREIHCHTYKLLRMDLKLNPTKVFKKTKLSDAMINEEAWYYKPTEKPELDASDLLFLLEDFLFKAENVLKDKKYLVLHRGKSTNSAVESISTDIFITGSIKILPKICAKIELLSTYCKDLLEANDKVYDALGMFPKDSADIKLSLGAALKLIADLLSWHGFRTSNYKPYLKEALTAIAKRGNPASTQENSFSVLASTAGNYLGNFAENVLLISGGLSLVKAVQACIEFCQVSTATQKCSLAKICCDMLLRPWYTVTGVPERGATFNQHVNSLLKTYFSFVENKLQVVKSLTQIVFDECENLTGKDSTLKTFKTINKNNFPLMYRSLCEALLSAASERLSQLRDDHEMSLNIWNDVVQTLLMLIEIVKLHSSRINLSALLQRSQGIIQLYLSKGMPVMESALRVKSTQVLKLMKSLQAVTRFLHSICCHSKLTSDATVSAHVPAIRSLCERLTLEVKGMLILNKISLDCFIIATLKNKDLQGNDILSQEIEENEEVLDFDSVLPPEESSDVEEGDVDVSTQESNSEVY